MTPSHHGILHRIDSEVTVNPAANKIEEFNAVPNLEKFVNTDAIESMERMVSAQLLLISHSSFSYLPGLLNKNGVTIYHEFWHRPKHDWIQADDTGDFSKKAFKHRLKSNFELRGFCR